MEFSCSGVAELLCYSDGAEEVNVAALVMSRSGAARHRRCTFLARLVASLYPLEVSVSAQP
jgi:hypothetical protein